MGHRDENDNARDPGRAPVDGGRRPLLTRREREILALLADGLSGAQIAERLVLSPETVRTHVRNAMAKLGASTRSQAVALALQQREIAAESQAPPPEPEPSARPDPDAPLALAAMVGELVSLYDVDAGAVYVPDDDGLALLRVASAGDALDAELPPSVAFGDGALGRAALERRSQLHKAPGTVSSGGALIAAPMIGEGRLLGVIALAARVSRPVGRSELLLLQAFSNRVGEVLVTGGNLDRRLERSMERFRASWSATPRVV